METNLSTVSIFFSFFIYRRADKEPNQNSRVCSCHFREGNKKGGPVVFKRNAEKLFPQCEESTVKKRVKQIQTPSTPEPVSLKESEVTVKPKLSETETLLSVENTILKAEVRSMETEIVKLKERQQYARQRYTVASQDSEVICMETGLPTREIFQIIVDYVSRFHSSIVYFSGWKVECIELEDQIWLTLMKLKQNYTNLHLAQLFHCSTSTVSNIVLTFIHVLHKLLYDDAMKFVPSRHKNKTSMHESFLMFGNCRMVIDCTDVRVAAPKLLSEQKLTYSSYRGMHSFKVLIGVAPNATITYVSKLFPGSVSDKAIVEQSGLLDVFEAGDLILADKGFLIQDIVPNGVAVNIPPFLNKGQFTESEIKHTKNIARNRIHVERANARIKDFKILNCIPSYLKIHAEKIVQVCAALVNCQYSLIREVRESMDFE